MFCVSFVGGDLERDSHRECDLGLEGELDCDGEGDVDVFLRFDRPRERLRDLLRECVDLIDVNSFALTLCLSSERGMFL